MNREPLKIYYVYILYDENQVPFYVGKGKYKRWLDHEMEAKWNSKKNSRNVRLFLKIRKIWSLGYDVGKEKVLINVTQAVAFNYEKVLIRIIGRKEDGGTLVNFSLGGKEGKGRIKSEAERQRVSKVHSGKTLSEWHKQRLREYSTGRVFSETHKQNLSKSRTGKPRSESTKNKIGTSRTGLPRPESFSIKMKAYWERWRIEHNKPLPQGYKRSELTRKRLRDAWIIRKQRALMSEGTDVG